MAAERLTSRRRVATRRMIAVVIGFLVVAGCGSTADESTPSTSSHTSGSTSTSSTSPPLPSRLLLVGDSVAYTLAPAGLPTYSRVGCSVTDGVPVRTFDGRFSASCADARDAWLEQMPDADAYLWLSSWEANDFLVGDRLLLFGTPEWDAWLTAQYEGILERLPGQLFFVTIAPRAPVYGESSMTPALTAEVYGLNDWYRRFAASHPGVGVVDLAEIVCPGHLCPETFDGIRPRPQDGGHYSPEGATWVMPRLLAAFAHEWERVVTGTPPRAR